MPTWSQFRRGVRFAALIFFGLWTFSWFCLYLDSIHERRRAEHLIADLKSFPFSTAGFVEVRDFVNRHGGVPILQFPNLEFPPPGLPQTDEHGHVQMPVVGQYSTCTVQDCRFEIAVKPRVWRIWSILMNYRTPSWFGSALVNSGIRPWVAGADFEIKDGMLLESRTAVAQLKRAKFGSYDGLAPLGYSVRCRSHSKSGEQNGDSIVFRPHITGGFTDALIARVIQTPDAPMRRAFDINLHCFTAIFRACSGLDELAPSAWADYQAGKAKPQEDNN
jgi:hypothetical protein